MKLFRIELSNGAIYNVVANDVLDAEKKLMFFLKRNMVYYSYSFAPYRIEYLDNFVLINDDEIKKVNNDKNT